MQTTPGIGKLISSRLAIYLGTAWVIVEASNFLLERFDLDPVILDLLIILIAFGPLSIIVYSLFHGTFNWKAIFLHLIILFIAFGSIFYFVQNPLAVNPDKLRIVKLAKTPESPLSGLNSVAVLPFTNLMGDPSQEYLVEGVQDGIIHEIGRLGTLKTISQTSMKRYKGSDKSLNEIASELQVDALIEGTLIRIDSLVELRLKVIDVVPNEEILWSNSYKTNIGGLVELYNNVSGKVAEELGELVSVKQRVNSQNKINEEAYRLLLKGNHVRQTFAETDLAVSDSLYKKAIEIDPDFIHPYLGLAGNQGIRKQLNQVEFRIADSIAQANIAIAERLDPTSPELLASKGSYAFLSKYEFKEGLEMVETALEADPGLKARDVYAHMLMITGNWEEAWYQINYAIETDPFNSAKLAFRSIMYFQDGKLLSMIKDMERVEQMDPESFFVAQSKLYQPFGLEDEETILTMNKILNNIAPTVNLDAFVRKTYMETKSIEETFWLVTEQMEKLREDVHISPNAFLVLYQGKLKNRVTPELWFKYMEECYEIKDPSLPYYSLKGGNNPFMDDPRYIDIMERMGLW